MKHFGPYQAAADKFGHLDINFYMVSDERLLVTTYLRPNSGYEYLIAAMPIMYTELNDAIDGKVDDYFEEEAPDLIEALQEKAIHTYRKTDELYMKSPEDIAAVFSQELEPHEVANETESA